MLKNIKNNLLSFYTVFKHLFKPAVTLEYPEKRRFPGENFRGKPIVTGCIKCKTCLKVCPTGAIKIEEQEFKIDLRKCIFCGNCAFYCPCSAIRMSAEYELATENKNELELIYELEGSNERNE